MNRTTPILKRAMLELAAARGECLRDGKECEAAIISQAMRLVGALIVREHLRGGEHAHIARH